MKLRDYVEIGEFVLGTGRMVRASIILGLSEFAALGGDQDAATEQLHKLLAVVSKLPSESARTGWMALAHKFLFDAYRERGEVQPAINHGLKAMRLVSAPTLAASTWLALPFAGEFLRDLEDALNLVGQTLSDADAAALRQCLDRARAVPRKPELVRPRIPHLEPDIGPLQSAVMGVTNAVGAWRWERGMKRFGRVLSQSNAAVQRGKFQVAIKRMRRGMAAILPSMPPGRRAAFLVSAHYELFKLHRDAKDTQSAVHHGLKVLRLVSVPGEAGEDWFDAPAESGHSAFFQELRTLLEETKQVLDGPDARALDRCLTRVRAGA